MPQFDKITFFNQIFWLTLSFLSFYFIILKGLLPVLAASLKTRKKLVNYVFSASTSSEVSSKKAYFKNLQKFLKVYKSLFSSVAQKKLSLSEASKTKVFKQTFFTL
uniref:ATP synthase F0 subunit 8 n=1 Tax=Trachydiscus minutus TaxID=1032745 RepID=A0A140F2Q4_9STRA|nr:ATP synthase F0 subunit 8 [Trachydiscus minutus]AML60688.1 ATP synthase F0 subunit 8 [Trachydiscus minutus]